VNKLCRENAHYVLKEVSHSERGSTIFEIFRTQADSCLKYLITESDSVVI